MHLPWLERTQSQMKKNNRHKINPTVLLFVRNHSVEFIIFERNWEKMIKMTAFARYDLLSYYTDYDFIEH